ncbi:hypothetical protein RHODGE_RHODGE_02916 [Rhodoplanes serenus]|uniref:Toprim domain-containing protein n=2 Tax=Rhodoplanes serenus TaxID=200615 RepID=A0A3S5CYH0_9BRAD|nr:toprim domain-containing protein [Rhodoplanes serenus]VCU09747.1 hypothetical protein RHODGE_RHODGE_02916 [Rhodoplanes serenus]
MIAPFGIPNESEPGRLEVTGLTLSGIHLTLLNSQGTAKAGTERDKLMLGPSAGRPIVLAPPTDLLGLAVTEGIEDALSVHYATGLGAWAAGAAGRLPALADAIPEYIDVVTIIADADKPGVTNAQRLSEKLKLRGVRVEVVMLAAANDNWSK